MSQDPLLYEAGDSNLYRYAQNRPLRSSDPSGLTIYVYAFEGAGAKLRISLAPVGSVVQQAVTAGAKQARQPLVYRYYSWAGTALAAAALTIDWAGHKQGDKFVDIGYSWGGNAADIFGTAALALRKFNWNVIFTIDPVNGIPGIPFLPVPWRMGRVWTNYYENVDTGSLLGFLPIRGQRIGGATNQLVTAADFARKDFYYDLATGTEQNYGGKNLFAGVVNAAHVLIPYYKPLLDALKAKIATL